MALFLSVVWFLLATCWGRDLTAEPGHLQPFGDKRPSLPVDEVEGFPNPEDFFENYVKPLKPLKMTNAAKLSPAFFKWTDRYFLEEPGSASTVVSVETVKKESRQQNVLEMTFKEFVESYNQTENYMVNAVPAPFQKDIVIPCPLQCNSLIDENFVDNVMWYSSGGTKSVVHTDSVDNINCLYRGSKTLIFVDPEKHGHNVDIDHPEGSYSGMDVDKVDYTKFPGMADVDFYHVNITAGDCLYIPYMWIHQVRSYGSNLAVNVWWRHHLSKDLDYEKCNVKQCKFDLTLSDATFTGFDGVGFDPSQIRDHIMQSLGPDKKLTFTQLAKYLVGSELKVPNAKDIYSDMYMVFQALDTDEDAVVTKEEIKNAPNAVFLDIAPVLDQLARLFGEEEEEGEEPDPEEWNEEEKHDEL